MIGPHSLTADRSRSRNAWSRPGICLVLLSALAGCSAKEKPAPPRGAPTVVVSKPVSREVSDFEDFVGQTGAVQTVEVRARVTGYLDKVAFEDGTEVAQNAVLFEVDPRSYKAELARAEAQLVQNEAHHKRLEADYRRVQSLVAREAIARQDYDQTAGDYAEAGAMVGIAKAARDLAELNLSFCKVTAPIAGRLSRRMVDPGNLVQADQTALTSIVSLDPMYVYFDIDERTLLKIRRLISQGKIRSRESGAEVPVFGSLSDEADFPHKGMINFSENRLDTATGTLRVRAIIPNPKPRVLSPGLFMKVRLPVGTPHTARLIPEEALGTDQGSKFVYVVKSRPKKLDAGPEAKGAAATKESVVKKDGAESPKATAVARTAVSSETEDYVLQQNIKVGNAYFKRYREVIDGSIGPDDRIVVSGLQRVRPNMAVVAQLRKEEPLPAVAEGSPEKPPAGRVVESRPTGE